MEGFFSFYSEGFKPIPAIEKLDLPNQIRLGNTGHYHTEDWIIFCNWIVIQIQVFVVWGDR